MRQCRDGWTEQFADMARRGDDQLLDADSLTPTDWDGTEWEWESASVSVKRQAVTTVPIGDTS